MYDSAMLSALKPGDAAFPGFWRMGTWGAYRMHAPAKAGSSKTPGG